MMKRIQVSGSMNGQTAHFARVKVEKIEGTCSECGAKTFPEKPYGTIFVPLSAGTPDEILIRLEKGDGPKGKEGP